MKAGEVILTVKHDCDSGNRPLVSVQIGDAGWGTCARMHVELGSDVPGQADTRRSRIIFELPAEIAEDVASLVGINCFPAPPRPGLLQDLMACLANQQRQIDELREAK